MYEIEQCFYPASLEEAMDLAEKWPQMTWIAGGTDLLIKARKAFRKEAGWISLQKLDTLRGIREDDSGSIHIGALCTFTELSLDGIIAGRVPMLQTAALSVGGPQIRNMATIGGNICNGVTSADSASSLMALEARLCLCSGKGCRQIKIEDFYLGPGKVDRKPGEILTDIILPMAPAEVIPGAYTKFSTRKAMDIATLGVAAICAADSKGKIKKARIALGVAAPTPIRCTRAEKFLEGKMYSWEIASQAACLAKEEAHPRTSWRASKEYRETLIEELTARTLEEAFQMAGGKKNETDNIDTES